MESVDPFAANGNPGNEQPRPTPAGAPPETNIVAFLRDAWGVPAYNRSAFKELLDVEIAREQTVRARPKKTK